jgi:hypothetical protein
MTGLGIKLPNNDATVPDLAGIRNAAALAKLPAGEQKAFTFDENVLACHACHYGTVVRLPVVDQYLARVGPTHRRALWTRATKAPRVRVPRAKAQPDRQKPRLARNRLNGFPGR